MLGLGITFEYPQPSELVARHISVELPAVGDSVNIRFEGEIKNASLLVKCVRVGVEFVGFSEAEKAIAAALSVMSETLVTS